MTDATTTAPSRKTLALGTDLAGVSGVDEAITKAGLGWGLNVVEAENMTILLPDGVTSTSIPGQRLVMRDDNHVTLGAVGGRYTAVDNREVFSVANHILQQGGKLARGGELDHGRKVFMTLDLPGTTVEVGGLDLVEFSVVIKASHDGTGNVSAGLVGKRLVCTNGMTVSIKGLAHTFSIRHTANASARLEEAQTILKGAARYAKEFAAVAEHMLDTKFTKEQFAAYIDRLWPAPKEEGKRAHTTWEARRNELLSLFTFAETNRLGRETQWGAFNSVVEYLDWEAPVRSHNGNTADEVRARRQFDATNQSAKDLAFASLVG